MAEAEPIEQLSIEQPAAQKVYASAEIPIVTLTDRVRHVVQSAFDGRRIVIFSGRPAESDEVMLDEARAIRGGGGFGPEQDSLLL